MLSTRVFWSIAVILMVGGNQLPVLCTKDFRECYFGHIENESMVSGANDIVVVKQTGDDLLCADDSLCKDQKALSFKATQLNVRVGKFENMRTLFRSREGKRAKIFVNNRRVRTSGAVAYLADSGAVLFNRLDHPCTFSSDELQSMDLRLGRNDGLLVVPELDVQIPFNIHLLLQSHRLVLTDIDGTITTEDVSGFLLPQVGVESHHANVTEFLRRVSANGYVPVYLSARPLSLSQLTREYLFQSSSGSVSVPKGPLFVSPKVTVKWASNKSTSADKTKTILSLADLFEDKQDVVASAFGNKYSDVRAYLDAGIKSSHIYRIDKSSVIRNVRSMEETSYQDLVDNIDTLYPKI